MSTSALQSLLFIGRLVVWKMLIRCRVPILSAIYGGNPSQKAKEKIRGLCSCVTSCCPSRTRPLLRCKGGYGGMGSAFLSRLFTALQKIWCLRGRNRGTHTFWRRLKNSNESYFVDDFCACPMRLFCAWFLVECLPTRSGGSSLVLLLQNTAKARQKWKEKCRTRFVFYLHFFFACWLFCSLHKISQTQHHRRSLVTKAKKEE